MAAEDRKTTARMVWPPHADVSSEVSVTGKEARGHTDANSAAPFTLGAWPQHEMLAI